MSIHDDLSTVKGLVDTKTLSEATGVPEALIASAAAHEVSKRPATSGQDIVTLVDEIRGAFHTTHDWLGAYNMADHGDIQSRGGDGVEVHGRMGEVESLMSES